MWTLFDLLRMLKLRFMWCSYEQLIIILRQTGKIVKLPVEKTKWRSAPSKTFLFAAACFKLNVGLFLHIFDCTLSSFYIALFFQNIFSLMPFMFYVNHFACLPCCNKNKLTPEDSVVEVWMKMFLS